jgi:hypothetical protein
MGSSKSYQALTPQQTGCAAAIYSGANWLEMIFPRAICLAWTKKSGFEKTTGMTGRVKY